LSRNYFSQRIKLGLDLQAAHTGAAVQVQEAIRAGRNRPEVDRLTSSCATKIFTTRRFGGLTNTHILGAQRRFHAGFAFRDLVQQQYGALWDSAPPAGEPSVHPLRSSQARLRKFKRTPCAALETIDRRINALGLTEPTIQRRAER